LSGGGAVFRLMKPRHAAALALVGAVLGLLVPICYLALFKLGSTLTDCLRWLWLSGVMLLRLDVCCGRHAPAPEVVWVTTESIAVNVLIYIALMLSIGACVGKLRTVVFDRE
jgi:uncharacterized membrane protein YjfL (UPF0719 family)